MYFICACMYVCSNPVAILEQTYAVYNAAWVVSQNFYTSNQKLFTNIFNQNSLVAIGL